VLDMEALVAAGGDMELPTAGSPSLAVMEVTSASDVRGPNTLNALTGCIAAAAVFEPGNPSAPLLEVVGPAAAAVALAGWGSSLDTSHSFNVDVLYPGSSLPKDSSSCWLRSSNQMTSNTR